MLTDAKRDKILSNVSYPSTMLYGTSLSKETILSIVNRKLALLKLANEGLQVLRIPKHELFRNDIRSYISCWYGVLAYLEGSRSWDSCKGVNNPYLMGNAKIID